MRSPWTSWLRAWGIFSFACTCLAFLLWEPVNVAITAFLSAVVTVVLVMLGDLDASREPRSSKRRFSHLVRPAVFVALAVVALGLVASVSGPGLLLVLVLAGVTMPPARSGLRLALGGPAAPGSLTGPVEPGCTRLPTKPLAELTDQELCSAWRSSFAALHATTSPLVAEAVVALRQLCLDEMEKRDPEALQAWLESGARASDGPDRFLLRTEPEEPPRAA